MPYSASLLLPQSPRPIVIIGAGGIVHDAHLPAYRIAGFDVIGIFDLNREKAQALADQFQILHIYESLAQLVQDVPEDVVFDVAVPGSAVLRVLEQLPDGASVLIQKPMGEDYAAAKAILALTRAKRMNAGINFQLRYAPFVQVARQMLDEGLIGELCDLEVNVNVYTPWHLWDFLFTAPRVEILYHSIHYLDLIRSFLGNPERLYAKTTKHPAMAELASVRTTMILDYGEWQRANILTNHAHQFGLHHQHSYIKFEGTKGAIRIKLGLLMNYPEGVSDAFEYVVLEEGKAPTWQTLDIEGSWFPHAFIGSMAQVMRAAEGSIERPDNSVEDCIDTMACVEAAHQSSAHGGVSLHDYLQH
ncbi:Predicted dehydrogenase [Catalinimonas alkaloidigena]|uniref:Predicted dehydrogenase n=1 Tax=Catalinimonas alkaloidigena TaxID=1075417 RepID=A0A1G9M0N2_9BACT|nr:Gfo/Idh/MocA family oxidoreductase [Catalinimonas alkaloidigena]SDL67285.1 Predicted dehydrogenase [Catalinimonas alkaloidigena]